MENMLIWMVLINYKITQVSGVLEWTVIGKVTDYGQNVTLFCNVPNCCPQDAGWDSWTPVQHTLFIDVKTGRSNKKYDGRVMKDGYTLVIQNLTKHDLNVSYSCLYGVTLGEQKLLLEDDAFTYFIPGQTDDQTAKSIISKGHIAGIMVGVVALSAAAVALFFHNWRRRKKRKFKYKVPNEDIPLIVKDDSHIECKEGEDAKLTYKSQNENLSVKLLKAGNIHTEHEYRDGLYNFVLMNTKTVDSGEYNLEVGRFFRKKFQLQITAYFLEDPSDIECNEGEEAIITCRVHPGSPSANWFKNDNDLSENDKYEIRRDGQPQLKVLQSKLDDIGEYSVHVGKSFRKVQLKIKAYFLEDPIDIECMEGNEAIITCKVHPGSPSVKWFKKDNDLSENSNYEISSRDNQHQLKVLQSKLDDIGEYYVHVGKSFRKVQLKIKAYFLEDPSDIECTEGEEAIITCKVHPGSPSVKWFKNDNDLSGNNNYEISRSIGQQQLKVLQSKLDDIGEYCVHVGKSFRKVQLKIKAYFLEDPIDIECMEGDEAIITCKVHPGSPSVKWFKNDCDLLGNNNYKITSVFEHQLKLLESKLDDKGEYCVHVGKSFRKVQLKVKEDNLK